MGECCTSTVNVAGLQNDAAETANLLTADESVHCGGVDPVSAPLSLMFPQKTQKRGDSKVSGHEFFGDLVHVVRSDGQGFGRPLSVGHSARVLQITDPGEHAQPPA